MEGINGNGGIAATYGFSAKPQVISGKQGAGPYRDPYREYMYEIIKIFMRLSGY